MRRDGAARCPPGGHGASPFQRASSASHAALRSATFWRARSASLAVGYGPRRYFSAQTLSSVSTRLWRRHQKYLRPPPLVLMSSLCTANLPSVAVSREKPVSFHSRRNRRRTQWTPEPL